jgi:hypothetical protein
MEKRLRIGADSLGVQVLEELRYARVMIFGGNFKGNVV